MKIDTYPQNLAQNILTLRKKRNLSQVQLAKLTGIPRSTITYLESGQSNPSLNILMQICQALEVGIEELLHPGDQRTYTVKKEQLKIIEKAQGLIQITKVLPENLPGMEIDKICLKPASRFKGTPHISNTREYLYCIKGQITVYVDKKAHSLNKGDVLCFQGDLPHAYENEHKSQAAEAFSVVIFSLKNFY